MERKSESVLCTDEVNGIQTVHKAIRARRAYGPEFPHPYI
jgi:hypothetical protein